MIKKYLFLLFFIMFNIYPIFPNSYGQVIENFVIFGSESVYFERDVVVSSGNVGSNGDLVINKNIQLGSDVFGDKIVLEKETTISGDAYFNHLVKEQNAVIQGEEETPLSLPILKLSPIPVFTPGNTELILPRDSYHTIDSGDFRIIKIGKDSEVIFSGGIYNTNILQIDRGVKISFTASTTINIRQKIAIERDSSLTSLDSHHPIKT